MKKLEIDYPAFVKNATIALLMAIVVLLFSSLRITNRQLQTLKDKVPETAAISISDRRANIINLTNKERNKIGLPDLKENEKLTTTAQRKACDMESNNYFSHTDPQGRLPWHLFYEVGYVYKHAGENLARYYTSDELLLKDWMGSAGHRENILSPKYVDIGVGICGRYTVQHFGRLL